MMKEIAIIGSGGHLRSALNILKSTYIDCMFKVYDDSYAKYGNEIICGAELCGIVADVPDDLQIFISSGNVRLREELFIRYNRQILKDNVFHRLAFAEDSVTFGVANHVFAYAYINSCAVIGDGNLINSCAVIEHECVIGSHNHISVNSTVCGRVKIGNRCVIGAGATVKDNISICDDVVVGAGCVVVKNIDEPGVYVGTPARRIK